MKKLFPLLLITLLVPSFTNAKVSQSLQPALDSNNITTMYSTYNTYVTNVTQINVIYTHDTKKYTCDNDARFIEVYENYRKYILPKNRVDEDIILIQIEDEIKDLNKKWLEGMGYNFDNLCKYQEKYITFVLRTYNDNKEYVDYKIEEIGNYFKKADEYLTDGDLDWARKSYLIVLDALKTLDISEKLEELVQKQIKTIETIIENESKQDVVTTTVKEEKKANTEENTNIISDEVAKAKEELGTRAAIFESLVPLFKAKDQKTQENVKALLKVFESSKDTYTRNIGIYFGYLVQ